MKRHILLIILLFLVKALVAQMSIGKGYLEFQELGIKRFYKGQYKQAIINFKAALNCSDIIPGHSINDWLKLSKKCLILNNKADDFSEIEILDSAIFYYNLILKYNSNDELNRKKLDLCLQKTNTSRKMIFIKGGPFIMGNDSGDVNQQPKHKVSLSDFYIDKYEITNKEYALFLNIKNNQYEKGSFWIDLDDNDCKIYEIDGWFTVDKAFENHPVVEVSWYGANAYAKWLGKRLPTEAEYEYVASEQGNVKKYSHEKLNKTAWFFDNSDMILNPIGCKNPNKLGIYDIIGGVWEWCDDWYFPNFYAYSPEKDPRVINEAEYKILRGGGYTSYKIFMNPTHRNFNLPSESGKSIGFRCVKPIP